MVTGCLCGRRDWGSQFEFDWRSCVATVQTIPEAEVSNRFGYDFFGAEYRLIDSEVAGDRYLK